MNVKRTYLYKIAAKTKDKIHRYSLSIRRRRYLKNLRGLIKSIEKDGEGPVSIISSNCFAGTIMQDLKQKYNSPTEGLYFMYPDYIEFLKQPEYYLRRAKLSFVNVSKYPLGNERHAQCGKKYPIALLGDKIEIHFLHYKTEQEAAEKWYRRAARVNLNNMLVIGMDQNLCSENDVKEFDSLPFKNKVIFSTRPIPLSSNVYMKEFEQASEVGNPYTEAHLFYRYLINYFSEKGKC